MTIPKWATGSDSGDFTAVSDDEKDAARQRNEETKREEHRDVDPRSTASMSPPRSTPIATSTAISDRAVYKRYIRSMGLINAGVFLILGLAFAFTLKFPRAYIPCLATLVHMYPCANKVTQSSGSSGGRLLLCTRILAATGTGWGSLACFKFFR